MTDFDAYCQTLASLGHDRHWIRRNAIALQERFERDPTPFPPVEPPATRQRDRYEEL